MPEKNPKSDPNIEWSMSENIMWNGYKNLTKMYKDLDIRVPSYDELNEASNTGKSQGINPWKFLSGLITAVAAINVTVKNGSVSKKYGSAKPCTVEYIFKLLWSPLISHEEIEGENIFKNYISKYVTDALGADITNRTISIVGVYNMIRFGLAEAAGFADLKKINKILDDAKDITKNKNEFLYTGTNKLPKIKELVTKYQNEIILKRAEIKEFENKGQIGITKGCVNDMKIEIEKNKALVVVRQTTGSYLLIYGVEEVDKAKKYLVWDPVAMDKYTKQTDAEIANAVGSTAVFIHIKSDDKTYAKPGTEEYNKQASEFGGSCVTGAPATDSVIIEPFDIDTSMEFVCPIQLKPKGFLPIISSPYGWRGLPSTNDISFHWGLDFGSNLGGDKPLEGQPVMCITDDATVVHAAWQNPKHKGPKDPKGGYGLYVSYTFKCGDKTLLVYNGHMKELKVKLGDKIKKGQIIGIVGDTGHSYGSHLHWEIQHIVNRNPWQVKVLNPTPFMKKTPFAKEYPKTEWYSNKNSDGTLNKDPKEPVQPKR